MTQPNSQDAGEELLKRLEEYDGLDPVAVHLCADAAAEIRKLKAAKDGAYLERNQCVAGLAALALRLGYKVGKARTAIEGWSEDWHGVVYIDLPTGQVSWHFHDSHKHLFDFLPEYWSNWDGHDTPQKYERLAALVAAAAPGEGKVT